MNILEKLTKKVASSASIAVTDSVKNEAKKVADQAAPVLFGLGLIGLGLVIFRFGGKVGLPVPHGPVATKMNVTTNNYFFDPSVSGEFVKKFLEQ